MSSETPKDLEHLSRDEHKIFKQSAKLNILPKTPRWFVHLSATAQYAYIAIVAGLAIFIYARYRSTEGVGFVAAWLFAAFAFILLPLGVIARRASSKRYEQQLPSDLQQNYRKIQRARRQRIAELGLYSIIGAVVLLAILFAGIAFVNSR